MWDRGCGEHCCRSTCMIRARRMHPAASGRRARADSLHASKCGRSCNRPVWAPHRWISRIQGNAIVVTRHTRLFSRHVKGGEFGKLVGLRRTGRQHRRRWLCAERWISCRLLVVVILPVHLRVLRDALVVRLATEQGPPHATGDNAADGDDDRCGQHEPATPLYVRYKQQDIHQKGQETE